MAMRVEFDSIVVDSELCDALLPPPPQDTVTGAVDYKRRPAIRSKHGRWRSACLIIVVEMAERIAYYGVSSNLITYLTRELGQSTATAAANVNAWKGVALFLPILGAVITDSFIGKYYTIVASSVLYTMGLGLLTLAAMLPSSIQSTPEYPQQLQTITFFVAIYLVAVAIAGHRPCVQAFGADQFDGEHPDERKAKSSFFNWWYFGLHVGFLLGTGVLSYVQDNLSWALGFGIPSILMMLALVIFMCGTTTFRFTTEGDTDSENRFNRIRRVLVEEAKLVLQLFPIWATSLSFAIFISQQSTFFTKQGATLSRSFGPGYVISPASLQSITGVTVLLIIPIYDRLFVPAARTLTGKPAGITTLQRVGTGMFVSVICMAVAAVIEKRRLTTALEHGLIDLPNVTVPMSIWWLLPQYVLSGIAEAFTMVGLQEFFYGQVPDELRSVGLSLYLSTGGIGSFLSSLLVSVINQATSGVESWFSDNLNRAHLDYFYWMIASLSILGLGLFILFSKSYEYKRTT